MTDHPSPGTHSSPRSTRPSISLSRCIASAVSRLRCGMAFRVDGRRRLSDCNPVDKTAPLQSLAGEGSALHKKYGVYVQHVGIVIVPENDNDRMTLMFPTAFRRLLLLGLEAYDLALSKLERNSAAIERTSSISHAWRRSTCRFWRAGNTELRPYLTRNSHATLAPRFGRACSTIPTRCLNRPGIRRYRRRMRDPA